MFSVLKERLESIKQLNIKNFYFAFYRDAKFRLYITELNTEGHSTSQLIRGFDANNISLGEYSLYTVLYKIENKQIWEHVTLKDTGEFYESFFAKWINEGGGIIEINADDIKEGKALREIYGNDIIGLSDENIELLINYIQARAKQKLLEQIV